MDELTLLREVRSHNAVPTDAAIERGRQKLLHHIDPTHQSAKKTTPRPRRTALRITLTSAATLTIVAALVGGDIVGLAGWRGAASSQAAEVLNHAAEMTIQTSDPVVKPGQFLKIQSTNVWETTESVTEDGKVAYAWLDTVKKTTYIPANRADEWVMQRTGRIPTTFFNTQSKDFAMKNYAAEGNRTELIKAKNGAFYGSIDKSMTAGYLSSLPRNPYMLLNNIYKQTIGQGPSIDGEALVFIADLLRTGVVPADLRAALYKAAALIPGVTVTESQATLDGHTGIAIGRVEETSHTRQDIIIDPKTGLMIGEQTVLLQAQDGVPAGTATTSTAIQTSVTDTAP